MTAPAVFVNNIRRILLILSCLLGLTLAGCQLESNTSGTKPAASPTVKESVSSDRQAASSAGITQEEAGIKIRVDIPEIKAFLAKSKQGPIVPALKQQAIPQGMTYLEQKRWILISHYRDEGKPSLLSVIDETNGQMVKYMELYSSESTPYTGHAGGVTISRKHVWISSDKHAYYLPLEDLLQAENGSKLIFRGSVRTDTRASFTTYADGVLWVGEFAMGANYPTEKSHYMNNRDGKEHKAWAVGYVLDPETDLPASSKLQNSSPVEPDMILSLPDSVQGMHIVKDRVWLSQSYGRNNTSSLTRFTQSLTDPPHEKASIGASEVPVWFLDSKNRKEQVEIPPMSEGLFEKEGHMYILFESGATKYKTSSSYALDRIQIWPWSQ